MEPKENLLDKLNYLKNEIKVKNLIKVKIQINC